MQVSACLECGDPSGFVWMVCFVKRADFVRVEVVHYEHYLFSIRIQFVHRVPQISAGSCRHEAALHAPNALRKTARVFSGSVAFICLSE